ncbi:hypothetical protein MKX03_032716 [Papaver bracteatum]|nr:hypothetical protein MKX03_032716 [Papaver bracteatum]
MKMNTQVSVLKMVTNIIMITLCFLMTSSSAANFLVGGASGWALESDMESWSSSHRFNVGDKLAFVYQPIHNVLEVDAQDYEACNLENPMEIHNQTNTIITLDTLSTRYFVCGTQGHCKSGLKVQIVTAPPSTHHPPPFNFPPFSEATKKTKNLIITTCFLAVKWWLF